MIESMTKLVVLQINSFIANRNASFDASKKGAEFGPFSIDLVLTNPAKYYPAEQKTL